jgi:hypothetical protein
MDPPALRHLALRLTGSLKAAEVLNESKAEWDAATIKALLLEVCQQLKTGEVIDIEILVLWGFKVEEDGAL